MTRCPTNVAAFVPPPEAAKRKKSREDTSLLNRCKAARHDWMEETNQFAKKALLAKFRKLAAECEARQVDMRV